MPAPTPDEVRACVVRMLTFGYEIPLIMAIADISETTVRLIKKQWEETGSYRRPETHGVIGRPRLLEVGDLWDANMQRLQYLVDRLTELPDMFLEDLQDELSYPNLPKFTWGDPQFRNFQFSRICPKTLSQPTSLDKRAMEQSEAARAEFKRLIRAFKPSQLVFADESSINRKGMYRSRGYAICGKRAYKRAFQVRGQR
ncbi:hypothetical protein FRC12_008830 [Ceratobasidium sp. 428]|nr:hypothetical protein FRC12_008830 [Ceratobasidium sp. 428]